MASNCISGLVPGANPADVALLMVRILRSLVLILALQVRRIAV